MKRSITLLNLQTKKLGSDEFIENNKDKARCDFYELDFNRLNLAKPWNEIECLSLGVTYG